MKTLFISIAFVAISATVSAQAKITFESKTVEYAHVKKGSNGKRTFTFKNTGDTPLVIKKVSSTSHLLTVKKPNKSIAPGKTGKIKIQYDTQEIGPIRRTITVYSNAKNAPVLALKVKGEIIE